MNAGTHHRRGTLLIWVLITTAALGGLLTLLATCGAHRYREREAERVRLVARAIADSVAAYAFVHRHDGSATLPVEPMPIDVRELVPPKMEASATISPASVAGRRVYHVSVRVDRGAYSAGDEREIELE